MFASPGTEEVKITGRTWLSRASRPVEGAGRRWRFRLVALSMLIALTTAACSSSGHPASGPSTSGGGAGPGGTPTRHSGSSVPPSSAGGGSASGGSGPPSAGFGGPVPAPSSGLYLGLFDNAAGQNGTAHGGIGTYDQQVSLEAQNHFQVAIDLQYTSWTTPLVTPTVTNDVRTGRIPLISWQCGTTDANVASGLDDAMLISDARSVAALGHPVMIRWFWEMEFTGSNGGEQGRRSTGCIGGQGPGGYIQAWRHIVNVFRANGATNVAWVFCPGGEAYAPAAAARGRAAADYYPGSQYVDWIAEDAYSRAKPVPINKLVGAMYSQYGSSGKPLIVCETGAEGTYQSQFISGIADLPSEYPNLKGVVYFNSHGPLGTYVMSQEAVTEFARLSADSQVIASSIAK